MRTLLAVMAAFLALMIAPAAAQTYCGIKIVPISKFKCEKGLTYIGPRNKFKYGGQCIYPLQGCLEKVEDTADGKCPGGTFVGSPKADRFGGQCLYPNPGWRIETRKAAGLTDCKAPEIYLGAAKKASIGGHCVKILK